ncbi:MAG TPA: hypothetical protein VGL22_04125 [Terracidiphilus sp.]
MTVALGHSHRSDHEPWPAGAEMEPGRAELIFAELDRILASRFFRNAIRSRQFLEFVVRYAVLGHSEQLKERTIGTEVFHRNPGYATGDDPVVRVQAGEVRRRLQQYYQQAQSESPLRIELPVGSYVPDVRWLPAERKPGPENADIPEKKTQGSLSGLLRPAALRWAAMAACLILGIVVGTRFQSAPSSSHETTLTDQFWAPVFATRQPVLICVAKPVVYRPSLELYRRYARTHPGMFQTEVDRSNQVLSLAGHEKLQWSQMLPYPDYGVAVGDAYSAVSISGLLGEMGKPSQVRIGGNYSFEDLRNSPDVILGAFNNKWTMQIMPSLHFTFVEGAESNEIREQVPNGRAWRATYRDSERFGEDYAIVARLLDSKTGQFTVIAAGLASSGTQAAGEFVSSRELLEKALRALPPDWQKKNLELVLKTTVTDSTPEPPQIAAVYAW